MNPSLIDVETPISETSAASEASAGREIEYKGERIEIPENYWDAGANDGDGAPNTGALAKAVTDLRRQLSGAGRAPVPDAYELSVPDDLAERITADADHPLAAPTMEWAKKHGLSQDAFNELTGLFYGAEAESAAAEEDWTRTQSEALDAALGADAAREKAALGKWVGGLLGRELSSNPDMLAEANALASSAAGVLLLKALRDRIGERPLPGSSDAGGSALNAADLTRLQASPAYQNSADPDHRATVAKVRQGWAQLYPEG